MLIKISLNIHTNDAATNRYARSEYYLTRTEKIPTLSSFEGRFHAWGVTIWLVETCRHRRGAWHFIRRGAVSAARCWQSSWQRSCQGLVAAHTHPSRDGRRRQRFQLLPITSKPGRWSAVDRRVAAPSRRRGRCAGATADGALTFFLRGEGIHRRFSLLQSGAIDLQSRVRRDRMKKRIGKQYCTLDHANKRRELAGQTPYQFWVRQATRHGTSDDAGRRESCHRNPEPRRQETLHK